MPLPDDRYGRIIDAGKRIIAFGAFLFGAGSRNDGAAEDNIDAVRPVV